MPMCVYIYVVVGEDGIGPSTDSVDVIVQP